MNDPQSPFRLSDLWRRRGSDNVASEPADVGTAFGLELSMLPDDETAATASIGAPGGTVWWRRLTQWSGH